MDHDTSFHKEQYTILKIVLIVHHDKLYQIWSIEKN